MAGIATIDQIRFGGDADNVFLQRYSKQRAKEFMKDKAYGDELNLPEIESLRAAGISDERLAKYIKRQEVPLGSQAAAQFGLEYLSPGANLRPKYVKQFRDAGYSKKDIREAYADTEGAISKRAAKMIEPKKDSFDLGSYDIASQGGKRFGLKDIEYLRSQGLDDEAIKKYASGLDTSSLGKKVAAALDLGGMDGGTKEPEGGGETLPGEVKTPEKTGGEKKARELLEKTITEITSTFAPQTSTESSPTMLGGTQVVSPSVLYMGEFSPSMKAPITQTIRGGGEYGDINISSRMSPSYKDIGNVSAGARNVIGETSSQKGGVETSMGDVDMGKEVLIRRAKTKAAQMA